MAKLTTRNAHEVLRLETVRLGGGKTVIAIRSDGAVLRKVTGASYVDAFTRWTAAEDVIKRSERIEDGIRTLVWKLQGMGYWRTNGIYAAVEGK